MMPDERMARFLFHEGGTAERTAVLEEIVLDLMMEVEALREAVARLAGRAGPVDAADGVHAEPSHDLVGPQTIYGRAYVDTAWLTHCSIGPSSGVQKLFWRYYSSDPDLREWRECMMLRRLGYSDRDIQSYQKSATHAETLT